VSDKTRLFAELSYNGTGFHGWQVQPNAITVQEVLDKALSTILRQEIETVGCGRTDTGVHAKQFYAHFDLSNQLLNMAPDAHARFDATLRSYEYHIHFEKDPFKQNLSWLLRDMPDIDPMNEAAAILLDYTDFSCFSKSNTQVFTNNCKISRAEWANTRDGLVFHISADRFLRNMVRAIVGTLMMVGKGLLKPADIHDIIESKNRSNAGSSVPACGLYLTEVRYPYFTH